MHCWRGFLPVQSHTQIPFKMQFLWFSLSHLGQEWVQFNDKLLLLVMMSPHCFKSSRRPPSMIPCTKNWVLTKAVPPKIKFSLKVKIRGCKNRIMPPRSCIIAVILKKHFLFLAKINESCFPLRKTSLDLRTVGICFYYQLPVGIQEGWGYALQLHSFCFLWPPGLCHLYWSTGMTVWMSPGCFHFPKQGDMNQVARSSLWLHVLPAKDS